MFLNLYGVSVACFVKKTQLNLILEETEGSRINGLVKTDLIYSKEMGNRVYSPYALGRRYHMANSVLGQRSSFIQLVFFTLLLSNQMVVKSHKNSIVSVFERQLVSSYS